VDAWNWTSGLVDARSENAKLKDELAQANAANVQLNAVKSLLIQDNQLLHFTQNSQIAAQYPFVGATVTRQVPNAYSQTITVNVGSAAGVAVGDPVVAPAGSSDLFAGLIGRVTTVTPNASSVELILDPDTAVSARVQGGTVRGVAVPNAGNPGVLDLQMVPQAEQVKPNQVVVTAGLQPNRQNLQALLPAGIPIGLVTSVSQSDLNNVFKGIEVTPFVDFGSLDRVLVLKVVKTP
jgi:rod shape-determining protein MreC